MAESQASASVTAGGPAAQSDSQPVSRDGLAYGFSAYLLWGLFPLYWPLLKPAGAIEILAQRMVWSLVFVGALIAARGRLGSLRAAVRTPGVVWRLSVGAGFVSVNWGVYIWGVNHDHVVETSLGYFINPLLTILLGVVVLHERLRPAQWVAVGVASAAIVVLTIDYGRLPWIALTLACSFAIYGFVKSRTGVGAVESLVIETSVLFVPAVIALAVLGARSSLVFGSHGGGNALLLMGTGVVTAVPLLLFAASARRLPLSVLGLLQYLAPVLQLALGVGVRHEPLPPARLAGFSLVWVALIILTADALRFARRSAGAREAVASSGSAQVLADEGELR